MKKSKETKNIFCQFENQALMIEINKFAKDHQCKIVIGKKHSDKIMITPAFVYVIDRDMLGEYNWEEFLDALDTAEFDTPCIIIDENDDYFNPKLENMYYLPVYGSINRIIRTIDKAYFSTKDNDYEIDDSF
jgi:hypothetical protein